MRRTRTVILGLAAAGFGLVQPGGVPEAAAAAACKSGYVWRDAADGDAVCVTPADRAEAKAQNANAAGNRAPGGGASGPNTCRQGYVWREAFGGDTVCVTPFERQKAQRQNAAAASHAVRQPQGQRID